MRQHPSPPDDPDPGGPARSPESVRRGEPPVRRDRIIPGTLLSHCPKTTVGFRPTNTPILSPTNRLASKSGGTYQRARRLARSGNSQPPYFDLVTITKS